MTRFVNYVLFVLSMLFVGSASCDGEPAQRHELASLQDIPLLVKDNGGQPDVSAISCLDDYTKCYGLAGGNMVCGVNNTCEPMRPDAKYCGGQIGADCEYCDTWVVCALDGKTCQAKYCALDTCPDGQAWDINTQKCVPKEPIDLTGHWDCNYRIKDTGGGGNPMDMKFVQANTVLFIDWLDFADAYFKGSVHGQDVVFVHTPRFVDDIELSFETHSITAKSFDGTGTATRDGKTDQLTFTCTKIP